MAEEPTHPVEDKRVHPNVPVFMTPARDTHKMRKVPIEQLESELVKLRVSLKLKDAEIDTIKKINSEDPFEKNTLQDELRQAENEKILLVLKINELKEAIRARKASVPPATPMNSASARKMREREGAFKPDPVPETPGSIAGKFRNAEDWQETMQGADMGFEGAYAMADGPAYVTYKDALQDKHPTIFLLNVDTNQKSLLTRTMPDEVKKYLNKSVKEYGEIFDDELRRFKLRSTQIAAKSSTWSSLWASWFERPGENFLWFPKLMTDDTAKRFGSLNAVVDKRGRKRWFMATSRKHMEDVPCRTITGETVKGLRILPHLKDGMADYLATSVTYDPSAMYVNNPSDGYMIFIREAGSTIPATMERIHKKGTLSSTEPDLYENVPVAVFNHSNIKTVTVLLFTAPDWPMSVSMKPLVAGASKMFKDMEINALLHSSSGILAEHGLGPDTEYPIPIGPPAKDPARIISLHMIVLWALGLNEFVKDHAFIPPQACLSRIGIHPDIMKAGRCSYGSIGNPMTNDTIGSFMAEMYAAFSRKTTTVKTAEADSSNFYTVPSPLLSRVDEIRDEPFERLCSVTDLAFMLWNIGTLDDKTALRTYAKLESTLSNFAVPGFRSSFSSGVFDEIFKAGCRVPERRRTVSDADLCVALKVALAPLTAYKFAFDIWQSAVRGFDNMPNDHEIALSVCAYCLSATETQRMQRCKDCDCVAWCCLECMNRDAYYHRQAVNKDNVNRCSQYRALRGKK